MVKNCRFALIDSLRRPQSILVLKCEESVLMFCIICHNHLKYTTHELDRRLRGKFSPEKVRFFLFKIGKHFVRDVTPQIC